MHHPASPSKPSREKYNGLLLLWGSLSNLLDLKSWWERLLELLSLLLVVKNQSVQERRASDLELGSGGLFSRLGLGRGGGGVVFDSSLLDPGEGSVLSARD